MLKQAGKLQFSFFYSKLILQFTSKSKENYDSFIYETTKDWFIYLDAEKNLNIFVDKLVLTALKNNSTW